MDKSKDLIERRRAVVARGVGQFAGDMTVASASGARLIDADGRAFIDLAGGIGTMNVGHCDETVVAAIREQAGRLTHTCFHVATYEPYVALCEKLAQLLPHGPETKVMLVNSGAEAVENAIKIARQATGRPAVLCFSEAFHGRTLMCMTLTSKTGYKQGCGPFAPEVYRLPFPNRFRYGDGLGEAEFAARELAAIESAFLNRVSAEHLAAIIVEPVQGEGGFIPAPASWLRGLRALCDRHGILLVCDEVQSGFCRTGRWAAYEHAGIVPDLSTWAKSTITRLATRGVREIDLMTASLPRSIRRAISTSPSRVSRGTVPISRRYMRTGSFVLSRAPGVRSSSSSSAPSAVRSMTLSSRRYFWSESMTSIPALPNVLKRSSSSSDDVMSDGRSSFTSS
jgi:4-aminobutyrate aminotransferase/(S)-3-amino-2-methylpropionate transaminase